MIRTYIIIFYSQIMSSTSANPNIKDKKPNEETKSSSTDGNSGGGFWSGIFKKKPKPVP
jgi:hypothetical protein